MIKLFYNLRSLYTILFLPVCAPTKTQLLNKVKKRPVQPTVVKLGSNLKLNFDSLPTVIQSVTRTSVERSTVKNNEPC